MRDLQKAASRSVDLIDGKFGWSHDNDTVFIHMTEEFGEIARQLYSLKNRKDKFDLENLKDECADVFILLSKLADNFGIDLEDSIRSKIRKNEIRFNIPSRNSE